MTGDPLSFDRAALPPLWLLRHGETVWNAEGRLQGRLDSALTAQGEAQARAQAHILQAARLPGDVVLYSSPAGRARKTAGIVAEVLRLPVRLDEDLVEVGMGDWQGCLIDEIRARHPSVARPDDDPNLWKFTGPGCETLAEMVTRVRAFMARLQGPSVIVTHGVTSRVIRCLALGLDPEHLSQLPGGQGVVHRVAGGSAALLRL